MKVRHNSVAPSVERRTSTSFQDVASRWPNGPLLHIPANAFTLDGFREWAGSDKVPEKLRVCFIDGEIFIDMGQEEITTHVIVKDELTRALLTLNRKIKLGKYCGDGVLVTNVPARVSNQPDGTFITRESLNSKRVTLTPRKDAKGQYVEIVGIPDCVIEIVSNNSVKKDTKRLYDAYYRAGIPEYWLIDARGDEVDFKIFIWSESGFAAAPDQRGFQRSKVFGYSFRLKREEDDMGMWEYTLDYRNAK